MTKILLNGQETEIPENLSIVALLEWLKLPTDRVAVERNLVIVPRGEWPGTIIGTGDRLEVVHFVGGGGCGPAHCDSADSSPSPANCVSNASRKSGHH